MPEQAILDPAYERQQTEIGDMQPGDSGWTTPWAMEPDAGNRLWLNAKYTIEEQPGGTVAMLVTRSAEDGRYRVDVSKCSYKWMRGRPGTVRTHTIPVAEVKWT